MVADLNWAIVPELLARLGRQGWDVKHVSITIRRYPDTLTFDSVDEAIANVRKHGPPKRYSINLTTSGGSKSFSLSRDRNIHDEQYLVVGMNGVEDSAQLDGIVELFGLTPDELATFQSVPSRTAFVAHKFDRTGNEAADKLARFLELLGFAVQTGRGYAPGPISEKVLARIERQSTIFAILTPGDDNTWLTQESIVAEVQDKPLFILKERTAEFKPGILADHEFIPFENSGLEATFVPILEGLRELGYLDFEE